MKSKFMFGFELVTLKESTNVDYKSVDHNRMLNNNALFGIAPLHNSAPGAGEAAVENHGVAVSSLRRFGEWLGCRRGPKLTACDVATLYICGYRLYYSPCSKA